VPLSAVVVSRGRGVMLRRAAHFSVYPLPSLITFPYLPVDTVKEAAS
jgi:hypothetical protein